jgi:hypothetical protein
VPATRVAPELPPVVDVFFSKALAIAPQERHADAAAFTAAFDRVVPHVGRTTIQFGTARRMLGSMPDEIAVPATMPVAPATRDPAGEVTVRKVSIERSKSEPPPPAVLVALEMSDDAPESVPTTVPVPFAVTATAAQVTVSLTGSEPPAPLAQPVTTTPVQPETPVTPSGPAPVAEAEVAERRESRPSPSVEQTPPTSPEPSGSLAPPNPSARGAGRGSQRSSRRLWIAGGVALAAIAASVAALQLRGRPGKDVRQSKDAPIGAPTSGGATTEPAPATATVPSGSATATATRGDGVDGPASVPAVSSASATIAATSAPKPTSKPPPTVKSKYRIEGEDPYAEVPSSGGRFGGGRIR